MKMYKIQASCSNEMNLKDFGQSYVNASEFVVQLLSRRFVRLFFRLKSNKASGVDEIPGESLMNTEVVTFLHTFFNICFETRQILETWFRGIINPIPKASNNDSTDALSYRGITLSSVTYELRQANLCLPAFRHDKF